MTPPSPTNRRRVLIVSPNFSPINAPDMQRARMALPYLREQGWEPIVLAVAPEYSGTGVLEPLLEQTYPADIRVVRVRGIPPAVGRRFGVGSLWWRCGRALRRAGDALLAEQRFDVVFFTTTQFDAFTLGPRWLQRFGVPYVLDYQDPWINSYYQRTKTVPPGGWLKFNFTQWLARRREPAVVLQAAAILSVSDSYVQNLLASYPGLDPERIKLLPFGASPADFATASQHRPAKPLIDFEDGCIHSVYTGRCGPDMSFAMTVLFRAFRRYLDTHPAEARRMRFHFIGTDYAPPPLGREWAMPIARAEGVESSVNEHCYRVRYFDALYYLIRADCLTVVGSNDPSYTASKLFPYVLAQRPLLLIFHQQSLAPKLALKIGAGMHFTFTDSADVERLTDDVYTRWFVGEGWRSYRGYDEEKMQPFTAANMTRQLGACFALAAKNPSSSS